MWILEEHPWCNQLETQTLGGLIIGGRGSLLVGLSTVVYLMLMGLGIGHVSNSVEKF